jgi:hypothetical protein
MQAPTRCVQHRLLPPCVAVSNKCSAIEFNSLVPNAIFGKSFYLSYGFNFYKCFIHCSKFIGNPWTGTVVSRKGQVTLRNQEEKNLLKIVNGAKIV